MLFQIADSDGDMQLTLEEFRTLIRDRMPDKADDEKIKQWYKALDRNGDGVVDASECACTHDADQSRRTARFSQPPRLSVFICALI